MRGAPLVDGSADALSLPSIGPTFSTTLFVALAEWASAQHVFLAAAPVVDMPDPLWPEPATIGGDGVALTAGLNAAMPELGRLIDNALAFDLGAIANEMERLLQQCDRLLTTDADLSVQSPVMEAAQAAVLLLCAWELARWRRARASEQKPFSAERVPMLAIWPDGAVEDGS
jgi:hypothetical protein